MTIFFFMVAAPNPQEIFDGENNNGKDLEIVEVIPVFIMDRLYSLQHYDDDVQNDKYNDKNIQDLVPVLVTYDLGMKKSMNFFLYLFVHQQLFGLCKLKKIP